MGLIEKITAEPRQRDALIEGTDEMPCCLSYIVSKDSEDKGKHQMERTGKVQLVSNLESFKFNPSKKRFITRTCLFITKQSENQGWLIKL